MLVKNWKVAIFSSLGLSLLVANSAALAQVGGDIVVPTSGSSGSSTTYPNPYPDPNSRDTSSTTIPSSTTINGNNRFACQRINGQDTVMYQPQSQPGQYFPWAVPRTINDNWPAAKRCAEIARRLESYRPDGLQELQVSVENNENIVCVTTDANPSCRIVLTVPRGLDPYTVRNNVFQNLVTADNGQQTIGVNTYTGRDDLSSLTRGIFGNRNSRVSASRRGINLKPYLDPKDGGTGSNLRNGISLRRQTPNQGGARLNPDRFR